MEARRSRPTWRNYDTERLAGWCFGRASNKLPSPRFGNRAGFFGPGRTRGRYGDRRFLQKFIILIPL